MNMSKELLVIDGSFGEGGGQILRSTLALSSLILRPVKIINIRAKRSNPGLRRQHIISVEVLAKLTDAEVKGLHIGSTELIFEPKTRRGGRFNFDIGTAGSISLVLQAALPVAAFAPSTVELTIRGGTDVPWSPPIDYMRYVLIPHLRELGLNIELNVLRRGHYPRGGGLVKVVIKPVKRLKPIHKLERGDVLKVVGTSHCVKLPKHVAERQAKAAIEYLKSKGLNVDFEVAKEFYEPDKDPHLGPGSGIVIAAITKNSILGGDALGARGKPAEVVGREAAEKLWNDLVTNAVFDAHMSDMILTYASIADGVSEFTCSKLTMHAYTNMAIIEKIVGVKFIYEGEMNKPFKVRVEGIGLEGLKQF